jgi:hypothetical protein
MSFAMDGNRQERKWLPIKHKALKWVKANKAPLKDHLDESPWQMGWLWHHFHDYNDYKIEEARMHKMHEQKGWIVWCPHLLHEVLKICPFFTLNWKCLPCEVEKQPSWGEGLGYTWCCGLLLHNHL